MNTRNPKSLLIVESSLTFESLARVLTGDALALKVPQFYDSKNCRHLSDVLSNIVKNESTSSGKIYQSDVDSFWNTIDNVEVRNRYFATAIPVMRRLRDLSLPFASPIDLLRLELDEIWPSGASLMRVQEKAMLFGITRMWPVGAEALAHQDILLREIPEAEEVKGELSQLGVNIYIRAATKGGELEIWDCSFSEEDTVIQGVKGNYGFDRRLLPSDSLIITPEEGDLILLSTTKVHAVRKTLEGERITVSGFIGHWGTHRPLRYWS